MFNARFGTALAFIAVVVCPLLMECTTTCQMRTDGGWNQTDHAEGNCPVKLTPGLLQNPHGIYSECVTVRVWMKAEDFCETPKIEILSSFKEILRPVRKKRRGQQKCDHERKPDGKRVRCNGGARPHGNATFTLWELVHDCVEAEANSVVSASYSTTSASCSSSYRVPDPKPDFGLSVNRSSKSVSVTVAPGDKVHARWCYQKHGKECKAADSPQITIDPSRSRAALLNFPYLLPCVCVQVYYARPDSRRHQKCPFLAESIADVGDVWLSSEVSLVKSTLTWSSWCPATDLKIAASLCWRQHGSLCTPVLNSTLDEEEEEEEAGPDLVYNVSAVDTHPQMCVQFSLRGSRHIECPFEADMSSWDVNVRTGSQRVFLHLTSSLPAKFSAQLCVRDESGCKPTGQVHSAPTEGKTTETRINVPLPFLAEEPCVQVWRSDPALLGRRILCPDYTHNRLGMYGVAALAFVVVVASLAVFIHRLSKSGAAGWLCIQEPVLLVCSSERSAHVSAVCALASVLQGELSAKVHMALWGQSSQTPAGTRAGVADLGPLPWLYGQWEAVREARGKVLIVWSPEATQAYAKWREERANVDKDERKAEDSSRAEVRREGIRAEAEEDLRPSGRKLGKCKKERASGKNGYRLCDNEDAQTEPSTVIAPVFTAALARLEVALRECKGQGVALVYFQGLCRSGDIPKALRAVPRYCLSQDFRGLIQELGAMRRRTETGKTVWRCWPRLLSKVLSMWLAQQLAHRLQTLLPQDA